MAKTKYHQVTHVGNSFSERTILMHPKGSHKTACCDCGLVHDERFSAWLVVRKKGKIIGYREIPRRSVVVMRQVRRNIAATNGKRSAKKFDKVRKVLKTK